MDAQRTPHRVGWAIVVIGLVSSVGAFVSFVGARWNLFTGLMMLFVAVPWALLASALRFRPLPRVAAVVVACVAGLFIAASASVYVGRSRSGDALSGIEWVALPGLELFVAIAVLCVVWSAVRTARNRRENREGWVGRNASDA